MHWTHRTEIVIHTFYCVSDCWYISFRIVKMNGIDGCRCEQRIKEDESIFSAASLKSNKQTNETALNWILSTPRDCCKRKRCTHHFCDCSSQCHGILHTKSIWLTFEEHKPNTQIGLLSFKWQFAWSLSSFAPRASPNKPKTKNTKKKPFWNARVRNAI